MPASAREATSPSLDSAAARVCLIVMAALPALFALQTWQVDYRFDAARHFSLPIVCGEILVIIAAVAGGHRPLAGLAGVGRVDLLLLAGWLASALAAVVFTAHAPAIAGIYLAISLIHVLFGFAIWERLSNEWAWAARPLLIASAAGACAYAVLVYGLAFSVRNDPGFDFIHFGAGVTNVRQLGFYGLVAACLSAGLLATAEPRHRPIFFAMLTVGFTLTCFSGGRAAFAGAILAAGACVLLPGVRTRRSALGWIAAACLLAIPLSSAFVPSPIWGFGRIFGAAVAVEGGADAFSSGRLEMWAITWDRVLDHPILGHGQGQFRLLVRTAYGIYNHPHNWLLQFLYEWGLVGTALLLAFLGRRLASVPRALAQGPATAIPALALIAGLTAMASLEGAFFHPYPVMSLVLALAALVAQAAPARGPDRVPSVEAGSAQERQPPDLP